MLPAKEDMRKRWILLREAWTLLWQGREAPWLLQEEGLLQHLQQFKMNTDYEQDQEQD